MAFIRRVRTKSGATAVQIAEYAAGRQRNTEETQSTPTDTAQVDPAVEVDTTTEASPATPTTDGTETIQEPAPGADDTAPTAESEESAGEEQPEDEVDTTIYTAQI